jgi:hypothetical protein
MLPQRIEQALQAVVVDLQHQREQPAEFAAREPLAREPGEVGAGQVGDQVPLYLPNGMRTATSRWRSSAFS